MNKARHNILVFSMAGDYHSAAIIEALHQRGHSVFRYCTEDLPTHGEIELHYGDSSPLLQLHAHGLSHSMDDIGIVWNRRSRRPVAPDHVAGEDRGFVNTQLRHAAESIMHLMPNAFWANSEYCARLADKKPLQLNIAGNAGLRIAPTLISNQPDAIRAFLDRHDKVIHKPLVGHVWHEQERMFGSYTAAVTRSCLPQDPWIRAAPAIFQKQVPKQFEVRAQFFGDTCLAARIDSHQIEYGEFDWRMHQGQLANVPSVELPPAVHRACRALMKALGIVSGAFDFIVTPDDEWIFLEVNEGGQFLFLEKLCPELPLVDAFCAFLESKDPDFRYQRPAAPITFKSIQQVLAETSFADSGKSETSKPKNVVPMRG